MRLAWAATALDVPNDGPLLTAVGLGANVFWAVDGFPYELRTHLVYCVKGHEVDFAPGSEYLFEVHVVESGGDPADLSFTFRPGPIGHDHEPGWEVTEIGSVGLQYTVSKPGGVCVDLYFDNRRFEHSPYVVVRDGSPPI